jgi:hypothetical protein
MRVVTIVINELGSNDCVDPSEARRVIASSEEAITGACDLGKAGKLIKFVLLVLTAHMILSVIVMMNYLHENVHISDN